MSAPRAMGRHVLPINHKKSRVPQLMNPIWEAILLCTGHPSGVLRPVLGNLWGKEKGHEHDAHATCCAVSSKSSVPDPGVSCFLPTTKKQWQAKLLVGKCDKVSDSL